ncbi:hypothetical protein R2R35_19865 [Anaerocolumna sp. AGMB13020]|uniref:hypothetical protein n=1 Tax=Anaerocolumna sp. AGMB13020 TaxID=3081750 RepID=UPI00295390FE|nr:hypothetical protein [Anaerocolumna sp. AGMB13020]WOO36030.1 hypothetical protein R2R35_19865 [Anaerocolumna sp. AGMB13020]
MKLLYKNPSLEYSIDSILLFHEGAQSDFWSEPLFLEFPQIDKSKFNRLTRLEKREYLREIFSGILKANEMKEKLIRYQDYWDTNSINIQKALEDAFQLQLSDKFNNIIGNITLNPICPRFLESNTFDIYYRNSERGALGMALHEIIHFVWFHVWNLYFQDNKKEYEMPHLTWVLSEMVVDTIMRHDKRLYSINPYFDEGCAYDYFYAMKIERKPILETLMELYVNNSTLAFMEKSYNYCLEHETEIRSQMK